MNENTCKEVFLRLEVAVSYPVVRGRVSENALDVRHKLSDSFVGLLLKPVRYAAQPHRSLDDRGVIWRLTCESHNDNTETPWECFASCS